MEHQNEPKKLIKSNPLITSSIEKKCFENIWK